MTAPRMITIRVPLPTLIRITLALAAFGTLAVIPHLVVAAHEDNLPPQFMTAHAFTVVGLWICFFWLDTKKRQRRVETVEYPPPTWEPRPRSRDIDKAGLTTAEHDIAVLREIERRLFVDDEREEHER